MKLMTLSELNKNPRIPTQVRQVEDWHVQLWIRAARRGYMNIAAALLRGFVHYNMAAPMTMMMSHYTHYSLCVNCKFVVVNDNSLAMFMETCEWCAGYRKLSVQERIAARDVAKVSITVDPTSYVGQVFQRVLRQEYC